MRLTHNSDAVRGAIVAYTRGQRSRSETERTLRMAGWQETSIKRLLEVAQHNLKIKGEANNE